MGIIEYDIKGERVNRNFGYMYVDKDLVLREYDEVAKGIVGLRQNSDFITLAYDDESRKTIEKFFELLDTRDSVRATALVKDYDDKPRIFDMTGTKDNNAKAYYVIQFWDVCNVEVDYKYYFANVWKYRIMLGLAGSIYFDYNLDTKVISFFRYVTRKSMRLFLGTFEEFHNAILEYADQDEKNITSIELLCQQINEGRNTIEITVKTAFLHKEKKMQRLKFSVRYDDMMGHHIMYGNVSALNDTADDTPYYMTNAGLDPMTGLLNKRSIVEYTEDIITNPANAKRNHYMALIDIDDFKSINDNYGHQVGDQAIQILANVLIATVLDDGIIGRFGGDEFYLFTDKIQQEEEFRTMLRTIRAGVQAKAKELLGIEKMTLSIGVSLYPDYGRTYKELFALADKCLYIAKEKGKNRYIIYRPEMHQNIQTGAERKGISSYDEQSKAINQVVRDLFLDGREAIGDSMNLIVKGFDLDNIDIFYGKNLPALYDCGKYPSGFTSGDFINNSKYMELFDSTGLYVMNNYNNHMKSLPSIYKLLQEKNCMSLIQMALPSANMPEFFISFNMLNRIHKWSEAEISNLSLFGTLIYETIKGRR